MKREPDEGVTFSVKVIPRAHRSEIVGMENDALRVRLNAPPVEGRANEALIELLAGALGVSRAKIEIIRGSTSRHKVVRVRGAPTEKIKQWLNKKS